MSETIAHSDNAPLTEADTHTAIFAQMVMQVASTALVLMGHVPNPSTGKTETDLAAAQLFIGQLEMLEVKTKGNLGAEEQQLLKQNLMTVRMAFVDAVNASKAADKPASEPATEPSSAGEEESKKKFSKSYGTE